jgi:hypothetical protein
VILDENAGASSGVATHRYKWRGDLMATYGNNSGTHTFDNLETANALLNFASLNTIEKLFSQMVDPNTGEPINVLADTIITAPELTPQVYHVLHSISVMLQAGGFAQSGNLYRSEAGSPIGKTEFSSTYKPVSSRLLASRMALTTNWYIGQPSMAFEYVENWAPQVLVAPPLSHDEFTRDIVFQARISERGAYGTKDPRFMAKSSV